MNAEQAQFLVGYFANMMEMEAKTTAKVLAAVPDDKRDYRPDDKSRTAWELATHLATGDVWFIDSIINGKFDFDPTRALPAGMNTVEDVVDMQQQGIPRQAEGASEPTGRQADPGGGLLRHVPVAERRVPWLREQPQHSSPRAARVVPSRHGFQGAGHLRWQRRRADDDGGISVSPCVPRGHPGPAARRPRRSRRDVD